MALIILLIIQGAGLELDDLCGVIGRDKDVSVDPGVDFGEVPEVAAGLYEVAAVEHLLQWFSGAFYVGVELFFLEEFVPFLPVIFGWF